MSFEINNVRALQIFQILRQGAAILISIFLAKSILSTEDIGVFEMLTFIGTTVSFFWITGLNQGILPFFPKLSLAAQKKFIFNVFLLFCGISFFVFVLLFFLEKSFTQLLVSQTSLPYYFIFITYLLFLMPSFLIEYIYLVQNLPQRILSFGITVFVLQIGVVIIPIYLGWGLKWSIYGLLALGIFRFIWLIVVINNFGKINWDFSLIKPYLNIAIPLVLYALLSAFPTIFDNWVVGWFYQNPEQFAIFRYGARELPLAIALANALSTAMIPEVAKDFKTSLTQLKNRSLSLYHLLFPISIILMLTSTWWFPIVFNADFVESAAVFDVFLLIVISRLIFPQTILIALGKTKTVLYISILETLLNVILSIWLVQIYGLVGIAFGTVLAFLFEKIAIAFYLKTKEGIRFSEYSPVGWFLFYSLILTGVYFWKSFSIFS